MCSEDYEVLMDSLTALNTSTSVRDVQHYVRKVSLTWEDYFLPKYPVPFFEVRVADVRAAGGSLSTSLQLYDKVGLLSR